MQVHVSHSYNHVNSYGAMLYHRNQPKDYRSNGDFTDKKNENKMKLLLKCLRLSCNNIICNYKCSNTFKSWMGHLPKATPLLSYPVSCEPTVHTIKRQKASFQNSHKDVSTHLIDLNSQQPYCISSSCYLPALLCLPT